MATIGLKKRLTKEMETQLLDALESGMSLKGACNLVCISVERIDCVIREGKRGERLKASIERAQAIAEQRLCQRAMEGTPKDALNFLTTRFKHWDAKSDNQTTPDTKAAALLERLSSVPEVKRRRN